MLAAMSGPSSSNAPAVAPGGDPRVKVARRIVKSLAAVVILSLIAAVAMALINLATNRPAKELFLGPGPDPELVDSPFQEP